jgi:hypothetical protein
MSESESDFIENSPSRSLGRRRGRGRACGRIISQKEVFDRKISELLKKKTTIC